MKQISAAKFKEKCLELINQVEKHEIVITKRGKPVAKLISFNPDSATLIGSLKGKIKIRRSALSTGVRWKAAR